MVTALAISNMDRAAYRAYRKATVLVDRVIVEDSANVRSQLFRDAAHSAEELVESRKTDPEFNYLAEYINYRTPDKSLEIWKKVEHFLRQAVAIDSNHQLIYYDLSIYLEAISSMNGRKAPNWPSFAVLG